ncbi:MAG: transporter permease [Microbacteriaceae bacterium]|jgi:ribose transport system permease protein|nr:transporter permease [Microbacteriaceae bacterium]
MMKLRAMITQKEQMEQTMNPQKSRVESASGSRRFGRAPLWRRAAGLGGTELVVAVALVLLVLATSVFRPVVLSANNLENVIQAALPLIILAMGQLVVVATAGIDLSVGSVFSLSGMVSATVMHSGGGAVGGVLAGLATGLVIGLINGFLIAIVKMAAFIVTLVTMSVGASLAFVITGGNSVPVSSPGFTEIYSGNVLGIPNYYFFAFLLVIVVQLFMAFLVPGRWIYAIGSNQRAASLVGIPVKGTLISVYAFSGVCASFASVLTLSYLSNAEVSSGTGFELQAIAAVVIGGASLFGGRGTAIGALLGALIITTIQNVVNLSGISSFWQGTVTGVVILIAVLADRVINVSNGRFTRLFERSRAEPAGSLVNNPNVGETQ